MKFPEIPCPPKTSQLVWVYFVQSADGALYVGQSDDVAERVRKHRYGLGSKFTHDHRGARLVYVEGPLSLDVAVAREAQLKRWSRAKKEALVSGDLEQLHALSKSRELAKLLKA